MVRECNVDFWATGCEIGGSQSGPWSKALLGTSPSMTQVCKFQFLFTTKSFRIYSTFFFRECLLPFGVETFAAILFGCETWSLTMREEHRLGVIQNRIMRRIFGPKGDDVTGDWRKLHNEELNGMCATSNIIRVIKSRRMSWAGHLERMGHKRSA